MFRSIERLGLITEGQFDMSLGDLLEKFEVTKSDMKAETMRFYKSWKKRLIDFFDFETRVGTIQNYEAIEFITHCRGYLSAATMSRGVRACKTIFRYGKDSGVLSENPFDGIKSGIEVNVSRQCLMSRDVVQKLLDVCRDDVEQLLIVLGRYAGLRIPSEVADLTFGDLKDRKIRVHEDTKTGARVIPMFLEISEIFDRMVGEANEKIFYGRFDTRNRCRSFLLQLIERAGIEQWPKAWINMRSTLATELEVGGTPKRLLTPSSVIPPPFEKDTMFSLKRKKNSIRC